MKSISVTRSSMPPFEEYVNEIADLWDTRWLTNHGEKVSRLEKNCAEVLGADRCISCVNGHQALELAIRTMKLTGEVITSPYTFVSTTAAIVRCGLKPVFCDIRESDFTMDPDKIEELITDQTSAILPVHVYGNICDAEKIRKIAEKYHLKVIYDAAHAFGCDYKGRGVGSLGDLSVFSLHATKAFHSIEGGLITYKDSDLDLKFWAGQNFGISQHEKIDMVAPNAKMNEFQAAMGLCNLRHFDEYVDSRKAVYLQYLDELSGIDGLRLPTLSRENKMNYAYFPVMIDPDVCGVDRDKVFTLLGEENIGARKYFYPLTSNFDEYSKYATNATPIAEKYASQVLTLPLYSDLEAVDVARICSLIREILNQY